MSILVDKNTKVITQGIFRSLMVGLIGIPSLATAQTATFTVKDGRALVLGGETELGGALSPTDMDAVALVDAFDKICLPDPASAASRAAGSSLLLQPSEALLMAEGKLPEVRVPVWTSPDATLTLWDGQDTAWKGRAIAMPSRGATTTGPYGPFKASGVQCNLVVKVTDFAAAKAVTDALGAKYGEPGKLVLKNNFADGYWQAGDVRVNVNVPIVRQGPQPIHISAQVSPAKGTK